MTNIIKKFFQGIIYVITFPVFLFFLALFAIYGIFLMIQQFILFVYNFFTGRSVKGELPEDVRAKKIINGEDPDAVTTIIGQEKEPEEDTHEIQIETPEPEPEPIREPQEDIKAFVFQEEPKEENEIVEEPEEIQIEVKQEEPVIIQEDNHIDSFEIDSHNDIEIEQEPEEIEVYTPLRSNRNNDIKEDEIDDDNNGIDISFD